MCCKRLPANTGLKNDAKNRHLATIAQLCRAISSQLRHASTIGKTVKQQYLPHMTLQYGELRPTISGWDRFVSLGDPSKFQRVSRLRSALLHGTLVMGVSQSAALNRGRHLYSAGRPSRWALAYILVSSRISRVDTHFPQKLPFDLYLTFILIHFNVYRRSQ